VANFIPCRFILKERLDNAEDKGLSVPVIRFGSGTGCIYVCNTDLIVTTIQHAACNLCRLFSSLLGRYCSFALCWPLSVHNVIFSLEWSMIRFAYEC
jgi:hypothetical protein